MKAKFLIDIEKTENGEVKVELNVDGNRALIGIGLFNVLKDLGESEETQQIIEVMAELTNMEDMENGRE